MVGVPRSRRGRSHPPPPATTSQQASHRSHWRADGAPKSAYRSQGEALSVADERRQESGVDLNAYRCEVCSAWHLGNSDGRDL
jgi:hypothetical protein